MIATDYKKIPQVSLLSFFNARGDKFNMLANAPQKYPELFSAKIPGKEILVIHHPEMVQQILVRGVHNFRKERGYEVLALLLGKGLITNTDYANWRKQRTLLQPPFHRDSLNNMCNVVVHSVERLLNKWKIKEGSTVNFTHEMAWLTIDIVCKTLFTSDVSDDQIQMVWRNLNFLNEAGSKMAGNPYHIPWKFPLPRYVKARKYIAEMNELIYGIINKRKQEKDPPRDLLQLLIEARYEDNGTGMTDEQIRDEVMTIFVAGHETTVNALSWTWYLLKQHSECEQKLFNESKQYVDKNPGFYDIPNLKYGWQVMNESMRLYPPVPAIGRAVANDEEVAGYLLKKGAIAVLNISGLHHHPAYWENPFAFIPQRFENFDVKGNNRFIFIPFGGGPHICIGNNFAMMEMQLINAMLSSRVEMELVSKDIEPEPLITLKPGSGVMMKIKRVSNN